MTISQSVTIDCKNCGRAHRCELTRGEDGPESHLETTKCGDCSVRMCEECLTSCDGCDQPYCDKHLVDVGGELLCGACVRGMEADGEAAA